MNVRAILVVLAGHVLLGGSLVRAANEDDVRDLQGTWMCVESLKEGERSDAYVGVRAVFEGNKMTWIVPRPRGHDVRQVCEFEIDASQTPKHFDWYPLGDPDARQLRLYRIEGDTLYWSTHLSSTERPKRFEKGKWQFRCQRLGASEEANRSEPSQPLEKAENAEISWGRAVDPDGDCTIQESNETLTIKVPSGTHDLWYGIEKPEERFNAPRVLKEITGDFVAQVKVTGNWQSPVGSYARAAGLVIWDSENQYFRHERCHFLHRQTGKHACFTTPLYDRNKARVNKARAGSPDFYQGDSTWLYLERRGPTVHTWISTDGKEWKNTGTIQTKLPKTVHVGVDAINRSDEEFVAKFEAVTIKGK